MKRVVVWIAVAGCYSPKFSNCQIQCSDGCPNGLECDTDFHLCREPDTACAAGDGGPLGDANGSAAACNFIQGTSLGANTSALQLDFNPQIAQGDLVIVAIAENGPPVLGISQVADQESRSFTAAITSKVTGGTDAVSAIYYALASERISQISVLWTGPVTQIATVGEWNCNIPILAPMTGSTMGSASTGATSNTGALALSQRSLVVASLTETTSELPTIMGSGFTELDIESDNEGSGIAAIAAEWAIVDPGNLDVSFTTHGGTEYAGTAAAFGF